MNNHQTGCKTYLKRKQVKYNPEKLYIVAEEYFNEKNRYVLAETSREISAEIIEKLDLTRFFGKGVEIRLCKFLEITDYGKEAEGNEMILTEDGINYEFSIMETIAEFMNLSGEFTPGIYYDNCSLFFRLDSVDDISDLLINNFEGGHNLGKFKLVCSKNSIELFVMDENDREFCADVFERHPFTYFDFYCPVCRIKISGAEPVSELSNQIGIEDYDCPHYLGRVDKYKDHYLIESLASLDLQFSIENNELLILTTNGWVAPIEVVPSVDKENSFWGASGGDDYRDAFLFFEDETQDFKQLRFSSTRWLTKA